MQRPSPFSSLLMVASTAIVLAFLFATAPGTSFTPVSTVQGLETTISEGNVGTPFAFFVCVGVILGLLLTSLPGQARNLALLGAAPPMAFLLFGKAAFLSVPVATLLPIGAALALTFWLFFAALLRRSTLWISLTGLGIMIITALVPVLWVIVPFMGAAAFAAMGERKLGHALGMLALLATPAIMMTACFFYLGDVLGDDASPSLHWAVLFRWIAEPPAPGVFLAQVKTALPYFLLTPFLLLSFLRPGPQSRLVGVLALSFALLTSTMLASLFGMAGLGGLAILTIQSALFLALHERQTTR
ncbi:MAG: hypothetical protein AAFR20_02955 [Pseudomonadota bacterium]